MNIRLLNPLDAEAYLGIRLNSLQQSPEAFAISYRKKSID